MTSIIIVVVVMALRRLDGVEPLAVLGTPTRPQPPRRGPRRPVPSRPLRTGIPVSRRGSSPTRPPPLSRRARWIRNGPMWPSGWPVERRQHAASAPRPSRPEGNHMAARLMSGLPAPPAWWRQCCDALHPDSHPTHRGASRHLPRNSPHGDAVHPGRRAHGYSQFRAQLLRMAAEDQGHVTWLHDTLARGEALPTCTCPPTVAPTSWAALVKEVAAARAYEALLEPMQLAEQADPEMAEGFRRLRAAKQQHREVLLDMLVKSDPYALRAQRRGVRWTPRQL